MIAPIWALFFDSRSSCICIVHTTMRKKQSLGIGAKLNLSKNVIHPSKIVSETDAWKNISPRHKVESFLVIGRYTKTIRRTSVDDAILMRHELVDNVIFYCHPKFASQKAISEEGPAEQFFKVPEVVVNPARVTPPVVRTAVVRTAVEESVPEVPGELRTLSGSNAEDIQLVRAMGFSVDDDNDPAPENVPEASGTPATNGLLEGQEFGPHPVDPRVANGCAYDQNPRVYKYYNFTTGMLLNVPYIKIYLLFLAAEYILDRVIVPATNRKLQRNTTQRPLTYGEFLRFIGIWLFLSTMSRYPRWQYWSTKPISLSWGPSVRCNNWMSAKRFNAILESLMYTNANPPPYKDRFWQIREMVTKWNKHMTEIFFSGWVTCLDESMSIWENMYTCPGWMYVPRKPHTKGNEWHTICCGLCGILFFMEIVEGKDRPPQLPALNTSGVFGDTRKLGATVGLLLRMCKPIYHSGKIVILDSGFCVLSGIIELAKKGVFAGAQIKKRRYWPKGIPGKFLVDRFKNTAVGAANAIRGTLSGVKYNVFILNEHDYVSMIMSTYGTLREVAASVTSRREKLGDGSVVKRIFNYTETFSNHYKFRHLIDDHNNLRHALPAIEVTWKTFRWENRVFAFILAVSEINTFLFLRFFVWKPSTTKEPTLLQFRRSLALQLIDNQWLVDIVDDSPRRSKRQRVVGHSYVKCGKGASKFVGGKWEFLDKCAYQMKTCSTNGCKTLTRSYCDCSVGEWFCIECYAKHRIDVEINNSKDD